MTTEDTDETVDASFDLSEDVDAEAGDDEAAVEEEIIDDPWTRPGAWYDVHTQSGYEKKVPANLHARIQSMNMEEKIYEVVIPMEEVDEFKNGRKQTVQKKVFPGYLLVRCQMDENSWYCIRNTPGVTGFVGQNKQGQKPTPLSEAIAIRFTTRNTAAMRPGPVSRLWTHRIVLASQTLTKPPVSQDHICSCNPSAMAWIPRRWSHILNIKDIHCVEFIKTESCRPEKICSWCSKRN